jgi:hypothetical protein
MVKSTLSTAVAILSAAIVLLLSFIPIAEVQSVRAYMIGLAAILVGVAALIGILNLAASHWQRLFSPGKKDYYSIVLLLAFFITAAAGLFLTPADTNFMKVVTAIQVPVETSLMAVLAVSLAYIAFRLLQRRKSLIGILFVISFVIFLVLGSGWLGSYEKIPLIGNLLMLIPLAGARGLLLGIGLASLMAGLRILFGADRPYNG